MVPRSHPTPWRWYFLPILLCPELQKDIPWCPTQYCWTGSMYKKNAQDAPPPNLFNPFHLFSLSMSTPHSHAHNQKPTIPTTNPIIHQPIPFLNPNLSPPDPSTSGNNPPGTALPLAPGLALVKIAVGTTTLPVASPVALVPLPPPFPPLPLIEEEMTCKTGRV